MKQLLLTAVVALLSTITFAQKNKDDEAAIKKVIQQQENAWNKDDWEAFSNFYSDDGTLINFVGQFWNGKSDILTHFKLLSDCCLSPTTLKFEITNTRFLSDEIAIVYIEETLIADRDYNVPIHDYKKGDTEYKIITGCLVKKNNEWKIASTQVTLINQMISPHKVSGKN